MSNDEEVEFSTTPVEGQSSPRFKAILANFGSRIDESKCDYQNVSIFDCFSLTPDMFTCHGEFVLQSARKQAEYKHSSGGGSLAVISPHPTSAKAAEFFKVKNFRLNVYEPQKEAVKSSAKALERQAIKDKAVILFSFMDTACKERFLPGAARDISAADAEMIILLSLIHI